jgi:hypothetical protein
VVVSTLVTYVEITLAHFPGRVYTGFLRCAIQESERRPQRSRAEFFDCCIIPGFHLNVSFLKFWLAIRLFVMEGTGSTSFFERDLVAVSLRYVFSDISFQKLKGEQIYNKI